MREFLYPSPLSSMKSTTLSFNSNPFFEQTQSTLLLLLLFSNVRKAHFFSFSLSSREYTTTIHCAFKRHHQPIAKVRRRSLLIVSLSLSLFLDVLTSSFVHAMKSPISLLSFTYRYTILFVYVFIKVRYTMRGHCMTREIGYVCVRRCCIRFVLRRCNVCCIYVCIIHSCFKKKEGRKKKTVCASLSRCIRDYSTVTVDVLQNSSLCMTSKFEGNWVSRVRFCFDGKVWYP